MFELRFRTSDFHYIFYLCVFCDFAILMRRKVFFYHDDLLVTLVTYLSSPLSLSPTFPCCVKFKIEINSSNIVQMFLSGVGLFTLLGLLNPCNRVRYVAFNTSLNLNYTKVFCHIFQSLCSDYF